MTPEELIEEFEDLGSWEERYGQIIDLGRELEDMPAELKT